MATVEITPISRDEIGAELGARGYFRAAVPDQVDIPVPDQVHVPEVHIPPPPPIHVPEIHDPAPLVDIHIPVEVVTERPAWLKVLAILPYLAVLAGEKSIMDLRRVL